MVATRASLVPQMGIEKGAHTEGRPPHCDATDGRGRWMGVIDLAHRPNKVPDGRREREVGQGTGKEGEKRRGRRRAGRKE